MSSFTHQTGTVLNGAVELFYRRFAGGPWSSGASGASGPEPILILHGAGYYDSADWIDVAAVLARGREVVAYDARGYGNSSWTEDYSQAAQLSDITALLDAFGWARAVLLGHSRGGSFTLRYAHEHPERVAAAIFADSCPGRTARGPAAARPGAVQEPSAAPAEPARPLYASVEVALASTSRDPRSLRDPAKTTRLEEIFPPDGNGRRVLALRDPKFNTGGGGRPFDAWAALVALTVPTLVIRATASQSFDDAAVARVRGEVAHASYCEIAAGHDLANEAPAELIAAVTEFLS